MLIPPNEYANNFRHYPFPFRFINIVSVVKEFGDATAKSGSKSITLLLYGPPGTGKSEFVHYLGKELGKDVLLKHASDIQDPYVGMTEKNIAQAFHEAQQEKSILFFDEAEHQCLINALRFEVEHKKATKTAGF